MLQSLNISSSCKADEGVYMTFNDVQFLKVLLPIDVTDGGTRFGDALKLSKIENICLF